MSEILNKWVLELEWWNCTESIIILISTKQLHYGNNPIIAVQHRNDNILGPFKPLLEESSTPSQNHLHCSNKY